MKKNVLWFFVMLVVATSCSADEEIKDIVSKLAASEQKVDSVPTTVAPSTTTMNASPTTKSSVTETSSTSEALNVAALEGILEDKTTSTLEPLTVVSNEPTSVQTVNNSEGTLTSSFIDNSDLNYIKPLSETRRRKIVYVNQQQTGKINVQVDLNDIEIIVIPSNKDPQMSLLGLLLKSAEKSNTRDEIKKSKEIGNSHHDAYSKNKQINDESNFFDGVKMPTVKSRAPYQVDISSTIGEQSQPIVDIMPNAEPNAMMTEQHFEPQFTRSPIMQLLRNAASNQKLPSSRIYKRSIGSGLLEDYIDDDLTEPVPNSVDIDEEIVAFNDNNDSEFILLGTIENCGPGRKRNSYQDCVNVTDIN